jgi:hypothetical protein
MRYRLRTLLAITALCAVVAAFFAFDLMAGILSYIACLSLFMLIWRTRLVYQALDLLPPASADLFLALRVLGGGLAIALAAGIAFCTACTLAQAPFTDIMVAKNQAAEAEVKFKAGLWLSLPLGTIAALYVYWLSWPHAGVRREK